MAARLRAPGLTRAGLFLVLGTLFCAGIVLAVRALYGFPIAKGGSGLDFTTATQNGVLMLSLVQWHEKTGLPR